MIDKDHRLPIGRQARLLSLGRGSVAEARASLGEYFDGLYNTRRPHSILDRHTPEAAYFKAPPAIPMAA